MIGAKKSSRLFAVILAAALAAGGCGLRPSDEVAVSLNSSKVKMKEFTALMNGFLQNVDGVNALSSAGSLKILANSYDTHVTQLILEFEIERLLFADEVAKRGLSVTDADKAAGVTRALANFANAGVSEASFKTLSIGFQALYDDLMASQVVLSKVVSSDEIFAILKTASISVNPRLGVWDPATGNVKLPLGPTSPTTSKAAPSTAASTSAP